MNSKYDYYVKSSDGLYTILKSKDYSFPVVFINTGNKLAKKRLIELSLKERLKFDILAIHDAKSNIYSIINPYAKKIIINPIEIDEETLQQTLEYFKERGFELKNHQIEALKKLIQLKRIPLIMTVGSGKTIISLAYYYYLKLKKLNGAKTTFEKGNTSKFEIKLKRSHIFTAVVIMRQKELVREWREHIKKLGFDEEDFIVITVQKIMSIYNPRTDKLADPNKLKKVEDEQKRIYDILLYDKRIDLLVIDEVTDSIISNRLTTSHLIARTLAYKADNLVMLTGDFGARNDPFSEYKRYLILIGYDTYRSGFTYLGKAKIGIVRKLSNVEISKAENKKILANALATILSKIAYHYDQELEFNEIIKEIKIPADKALEDQIANLSATFLVELANVMNRDFDNKKDRYAEIMKILMKFYKRLFYLSNGFPVSRNILPKDINWNHPKIKKLREIITELINQNERVVVFSVHLNLRYILQQIAKELNLNYYELTGENKKDVERFVQEQKAILFISRAAERGINLLKNEKNLIIFEKWWTYHALNQLKGRLERLDSEVKDKRIYILALYPNEATIMSLTRNNILNLENVLREKYKKNRISARELREGLDATKDVIYRLNDLLKRWKYYSLDLWTTYKIAEKAEYAKEYKKKANIYKEIFRIIDDVFKGENEKRSAII